MCNAEGKAWMVVIIYAGEMIKITYLINILALLGSAFSFPYFSDAKPEIIWGVLLVTSASRADMAGPVSMVECLD